MGAMTVSKPEDIKAYFDGEINKEKYTILKSVVKSRAYYAAVRDNASKQVFAAISIFSTKGNEFTHKDMDESFHPYYYDCPKNILTLLTDPMNTHAAEWRKECWKRIEKGPKAGQMVRFSSPVKFTNGDEHTDFVFRGYFSFEQGGRLYRISGWKRRDFVVVDKVD